MKVRGERKRETHEIVLLLYKRQVRRVDVKWWMKKTRGNAQEV